jgi:hypothetical protein
MLARNNDSTFISTDTTLQYTDHADLAINSPAHARRFRANPGYSGQ